jgi:iron(III) transport system ATP-binding protein
MMIFELENVSKQFHTLRRNGWAAGRDSRAPTRTAAAVDGVSLSLAPGEVLALVGPSGCGKSTTLRLIAGYERPDSGIVRVDGQVVAGGLRGQRPVWVPPERRRLGMVFQDYALFPHLTAAENVAFGLRGVDQVERRHRVESLLATVGLAGYGERYPHQLSGGQQQRVALARALAPRPRAVLLDEPFNTLDAGLREQVRHDLLAVLRAEGVAVLLVTHDQEEAISCADRVAVMRAGRIEQTGTPTGLYNLPATRFVASFIGEGSFVPAVAENGVIDTPFGAVHQADPSLWLLSGPLELFIRPEDVAIEPHPAGNAVIAERRPRGPDVDYELALRPDPQIDPRRFSSVRLHAHAGEWFAPGTPVQVRVKPRHLVGFAGERAIIARCIAPDCSCPPGDEQRG